MNRVLRRDGHNLKLAFAAFSFAGIIGFGISGGFGETGALESLNCRELAAAIAQLHSCCAQCEAQRGESSKQAR